MKKNYLFWVAFIVTTFCYAQSVFINEIHYDNTGGDIGEGVEIAGPAGTDLSGYEIRFYRSSGTMYTSILNLSGIIPNQQNNMGTIWFDKSAIQNGSSDGLALIDDLGVLIQFLSYEGSLTVIGGPYNGEISTDIGVSEIEATTPVGFSLQLIGSGSDYAGFTWNGPMLATPGQPNTGQTLPVVKNEIEHFSMYPNPVKNGKLFIASPNRIDKKIEIFTMSGASVYKSNVQSKEVINISNLTSGIYMVKIEEEERVATRKLIVK